MMMCHIFRYRVGVSFREVVGLHHVFLCFLF
jgi:hypothetical protein